MKIAINAWTFPDTATLAEMAQAAADAGFDAIELVAAEQGVLTFDDGQAAYQAAANIVADAGLSVPSLATAAFWDVNYGSADPDTRAQARDLTLRMLDRAAWLGAPAILVIPAVVGKASDRAPAVSYADALNRTYDALSELSHQAEDRGVVIGLENVWNRFLLSPIELRDLIDRINSPWVGAYLDVGNLLALGYPTDWITTLGRRVCCVHVKDYRLAGPDGPGFCPLGCGDVDVPSVVRALRGVGYGGCLTFEGKGAPPDIARLLHTFVAAADASTA